MCVILAKPRNCRVPSAALVATAFAANPDGAGVMTANGNAVEIQKGAMDARAFARLWAMLTADAPAVLHFRIATSGTVDGAMCHPFPLTASPARMRHESETCRVGVAHNGILPAYTRKGPLSDTAVWINEWLAPRIRSAADLETRRDEIERETYGSRVCALDAAGGIHLYGHWYRLPSGLYASNLHGLDWAADTPREGADLGVSASVDGVTVVRPPVRPRVVRNYWHSDWEDDWEV